MQLTVAHPYCAYTCRAVAIHPRRSGYGAAITAAFTTSSGYVPTQ